MKKPKTPSKQKNPEPTKSEWKTKYMLSKVDRSGIETFK